MFSLLISKNSVSASDNPVAVTVADESRRAAATDTTIRVGDKLGLGFYEILENEESKWRGPNGRSADGPRDFHERTELTGQYTVQDDGSISIPLIGTFAAAGQTRSALIAKLSPALERLVGRKGYVNIASLERRPIYVVGAVKNPGAFKFEPGLTAVHAVALAGGMERVEVQPWQTVEARRQMVALENALAKVKRLLARTVVLQAKEAGPNNDSVKGLVSLVGDDDGKLLVEQERSQFRLGELNRAIRGAALETAVTNNRSELAARSGRLAPFDDSIKLRTERVKGLEQLVEKNLTTRAPLIQAQSELSELQDRRQQALIDADTSRQKLLQSEQDLAKHRVETRLEIEQAVAAAERESADAVAESEGSLNILKGFEVDRSAMLGDRSTQFEIVRAGLDGVRVLRVTETTLLEPGDLVRVRSGDPRNKN